MNRLTNDLTEAFVIAMFAFGVAFIWRYSRTAPWWRYLTGKAMVSLDFANVLILFPSILFLVFHMNVTTPFFSWYRITSLAIGTGIIAWRTWTVKHVNAQINSPQAPVSESPVEPADQLKEGANDTVCPE